jgi:hypothetical protein
MAYRETANVSEPLTRRQRVFLAAGVGAASVMVRTVLWVVFG